MQTDLLLSTVRAIIFGHAIADALGVPAEFESREKLHRSPVLDYQGYGAHPVPAGTWSDLQFFMLFQNTTEPLDIL